MADVPELKQSKPSGLLEFVTLPIKEEENKNKKNHITESDVTSFFAELSSTTALILKTHDKLWFDKLEYKPTYQSTNPMSDVAFNWTHKKIPSY